MCGDVCVCVYYDLNIFDVCFFRVQVFKKNIWRGYASFKALSFSDLCTNN